MRSTLPHTVPCRACVLLSLVVALPMLGGCTTIWETLPKESATQQALLSYAAMDSIEKIELPDMKGVKIYIDPTYLDAYHEAFVLGQLRARLMRMGGLLVEHASDAQVIIEPRAAVLSSTKKEAIIGIPSITVPVPTAGPVQLPELAAFKHKRQEGIAGLALLGYERDSRRLLFASDPVVGLTRMNDWDLLGLPIKKERVNLPEQINEQ